MNAAALRHLSAADPVMRRLIRENGACTLVPETRRPPFQSLAQAVAHQQLNGTAANTILTRFKKLFPGRRFPRPEDLASVTDDAIRAAGFSRAKVASLRDIAAKTLSGVVPSSRAIAKLPDEEIVARLNTAMIEVLKRPDINARLTAQGFDIVWTTPDEFGTYIRTEVAKWEKVVKAANIVME